MTADEDPPADYEVGYGRPPKETRFKPGQSGNAKGRPKGATGFEASLSRELATKITITVNGEKQDIRKDDALAKRLVEMGLKGNLRAIQSLAAHDRNFAENLENRAKMLNADEKTNALAPIDAEILRHFVEQARSGAWDPSPEGEAE